MPRKEFSRKSWNAVVHLLSVMLPLKHMRKKVRKFKIDEMQPKWIEPGVLSNNAKVKLFKSISRRYKIDVFVETGTYHADTVLKLKDVFNALYSIEISQELYSKSLMRCKQFPQINLFLGDSSEKLQEIVQILTKPAIFWLDAHHSGENTGCGKKRSPVIEELEIIFNHNQYNNVILIDDARCFEHANDFPTILEVQRYVESRDAAYQIQVKDDIIRIIK